MNKCYVLPHGCIPTIDDNNTMMDPVKGSNSNQGNEEDDAEVIVSIPMVSIVDTVAFLLEMRVMPLQNQMNYPG